MTPRYSHSVVQAMHAASRVNPRSLPANVHHALRTSRIFAYCARPDGTFTVWCVLHVFDA